MERYILSQVELTGPIGAYDLASSIKRLAGYVVDMAVVFFILLFEKFHAAFFCSLQLRTGSDGFSGC